jgi:hypothetical protein
MKNVKSLLDEYANEVHITASSFFAWKSINNLAAADGKIYQALQANALSWKIIAHSLQITFFTALGRIFDRDSRSLTVRSFLGNCKEKIGEFSKAALEARRLSDSHGGRPEYLDDYLKCVYVPNLADFEALDCEVDRHAELYHRNYAPIRHKLIAHKDIEAIGARDTLFARTNVGEVEQILNFLYQIHRVVTELHNNGRLTKLHDHKIPEERYIREDVEKLLSKLSLS